MHEKKQEIPLFISQHRFGARFEESRFGGWILNPRALRLPSLGNPNTGAGLDVQQLNLFIKRLSELSKRLTREVKKRGPKPCTLIGQCAELFKKHYQPDLDIKRVWAKVRVGLRQAGHEISEEGWDTLRNSTKRRLKREGFRFVQAP
jgi:hypothetical protein